MSKKERQEMKRKELGLEINIQEVKTKNLFRNEIGFLFLVTTVELDLS